MLLLWAVLLGLGVGYLRRGRLGNLGNLPLRGGWLVLGALIFQVLIFPLGDGEPLVAVWTEGFHILSYVLLVGFVLLNRRQWPLLVMGLGLAANFLVISVNGGRMPAVPEALRRAGLNSVADALVREGVHGNLILMSEATKLNFLGDILHVPPFIPFATAFSVGDLLLALGIALFLGLGMARPARGEPGRIRRERKGEV